MGVPRYLRKILGLVFLCSCLRMSEEEQRKNRIEEPSVEKTVGTSLETPFFTRGDWPQETWWEVFHEPTLNGWATEALAKNPSIQSAREKIELAKERANQAKSKLYPLVYFNPDGNWQFISHQGIQRAYNPDLPLHMKIIDLTLSFTYEFDFWDKYRNMFRAALSIEQAQRAELAQTELIISTSLARTYFALKTNLIKERIYKEIYDIRRRLSILRVLLLEAALDDLQIVLLAKERMEEAQKSIDTIQEEIAVDRHLLNILIGRGPDEPTEVEAKLAKLPPQLVIPETISLDLLSRRPDLMAQIWRVESLAHEVGSAKANFFPNINLATIAGLSSTIYNLLFNHTSYEQGINPTISLPLYTGGDLSAILDAKKAEFQAAVFTYNDMILKSTEEVVDTLVFAKAVYSKKVQQEMIVGQAAQRFQLADDRLKSGLDTVLNTLERNEELLQKELEDIDLAYSQYAAAIALIKSVGGGYGKVE